MENYSAVYTNESIDHIVKVSAGTKINTHKLFIVETDRQTLVDMLLIKGFTQAEIDAKMPVEESE